MLGVLYGGYGLILDVFGGLGGEYCRLAILLFCLLDSILLQSMD